MMPDDSDANWANEVHNLASEDKDLLVAMNDKLNARLDWVFVIDKHQIC